MKNLYRRYRPLKLDDIVGQEQVTEPLINSLRQGKIGHAYLFVGPRGCGKTSVARILAHEVNGFEYKLEDDYVDIIEIDGASNRGIDNIRELREKVAIAPTAGKYKVYIIDEVHMLTKEAFNALLKTLEEPPEHAIFIMATTDAYKVPITITSRAQTYTFKLADVETMFEFVKSVAIKEKIKITDEALRVIVKKGGGSFRDSLSLLDQISTLTEQEITQEIVVKAMGLPQDEKIAELLRTYAKCDIVKITTILKDLLTTGVKAETLAEEMISEIITEPKPELLTLLGKLPDVKPPYAEAKLLVALCGQTFEHHFSGPASQPSTSCPETPAEPVGSVENMYSGVPNQKMSRKNDALSTNCDDALASFDWNEFVEKVKRKNEAVYLQLQKTKHELSSDTLHIYPMRKIVRSILTKEKNRQILLDAANGVKISIHEVDDTPKNTQKDVTLNKISAIMGGEVINDGGENPFG